MNTALNQQIIDLYRKRAQNYDFTANLYYLLGYREWTYRRQAVAALHLEPGAGAGSATTRDGEPGHGKSSRCGGLIG